MNTPWRGLLTVGFSVEPVQIKVEGASMRDVWERRYDLAADAKIEAYEVDPLSIEEVSGEYS